MAFFTRTMSFLKKKEPYEPIDAPRDFFSTPPNNLLEELERSPVHQESGSISQVENESRGPTRNRKASVKSMLTNIGQKMRLKGRSKPYKGVSPGTPRRRSPRLAGKNSPLDLRLYSPFCIQTPGHYSGPARRASARQGRSSASRLNGKGRKDKENRDPQDSVKEHLRYHKRLAADFSLTYENDNAGSTMSEDCFN